MTLSRPFDAETYVAAVAPSLGFDLTDDQRAGATRFLRIAADMAKIVEGAPVEPDAFDLAPVFRPGLTT